MNVPAPTTHSLPPLQSRHFALRKFLSRSFWVAVAVALGVVLWALWYVSHHGFSRKWRRTLTAELEKRGVHMTVGRLTLNPFQGLVASGVQLHTSRARGHAMGTINEVVLDINYSNLVHGEPFLNAVELHNATLALPLTPGTAALEISRINARVLLPPHQLNIEEAEAVVHGLRVRASGQFVNPEKFQWPADDASKQDRNPLAALQRALEALEALHIRGGKPTLELHFSGDLARPESLFVEAAFRAGAFQVDEAYKGESIRIAATLAGGRVRVDQCEIKDTQGALDASASFQIADGEGSLQLRSSLDLPALVQAIDPAASLNEMVLYGPPVLEIRGSASLREPGFHRGRFFGRIAIGRFAVKSLMFEEAGADFSWDGPLDAPLEQARWYLHDVHIRHKNGRFTLNALQTPGDFRFALDSRINPAVFLPVLPAEARARLAEWEFPATPALHLEGRGPSCRMGEVEITGSAQLGATRARGVALNRATLDLDLRSNVLTCGNIKLERAEGSGSGTVVYDFNTDELRFQNVRTTLNPVEVVRIFDRELAEQLTPYRFKTRPALVVDGVVGCAHDDWQRNRLNIDVNGTRGMDYTFLKKELSASRISGIVRILGDRLKLENLDASLFGGRARGKADISLRKEKGDYTAEIATEEVDFPSLTKLYFDYDTSKGKLNGGFAFSGLHDSLLAIDGKGQLIVTEGNVFAIPIFGPFSGILNEILPGMGYNEARKGTCSFEMREGVVSTHDLLIEGRGFSIAGDGSLFVAEDRMDFTARINAQGLAGKVLAPVSYLLEYVSDGSLSKPVWHPKRLPKAMFVPHGQPGTPPAPVGAPLPGRIGK